MLSAKPILYSVLDLCPIVSGGTPRESFRHTLELARLAERRGFHRYWLAEHHNIPGVASAATSVVIGYVAGGTSRIRVGSGGIMLPNHAPLVIAEQFGTLESLYPGRIDLGLGRAPGGDMQTARALRRGLGSDGDRFPEDLAELQSYFAPQKANAQGVRAIPGQGLNVPIYLLGSSDFSARLAARLGLPFAFASHFAPEYLLAALSLYRDNFRPSSVLSKPHAIVGVNIVAADTDREARRLFTTIQQIFLNLLRGSPGQIVPPVDSMDALWSSQEQARVESRTRCSIVGSAKTVRTGLEQLIEETQAEEIIATASLYDPAARMHSFEILADVFENSP